MVDPSMMGGQPPQAAPSPMAAPAQQPDSGSLGLLALASMLKNKGKGKAHHVVKHVKARGKK